jgi:hypothetical protein
VRGALQTAVASCKIVVNGSFRTPLCLKNIIMSQCLVGCSVLMPYSNALQGAWQVQAMLVGSMASASNAYSYGAHVSTCLSS